MKAAVVNRYGPPDVIKVCEVATPKPRDDEVLVRVRAATVNRTDCGELRPYLGRVFFGMWRPRRTIFGFDFAGDVAAVGADVTSFKQGERVFGICPMRSNGAQAEYVCIPERGPIATLPENISYEHAVVCEGAYYADAGLKKFKVGPNSAVLIYGASGAIGTAAVQLATIYGADVTAVVSTRHLDMVKAIGADRVIDYTAEDFTAIDERFDYILDAVGKESYFRCRKLLKSGGVFSSTDMGPWGQNLLLMLWSLITGQRTVVVALQPRGSAPGFVRFMRELLEHGRFRAVIDRRYGLDDISEAYRYVASAQKQGIVVIDVAQAQ